MATVKRPVCDVTPYLPAFRKGFAEAMALAAYIPLGGVRLASNWFICSDWVEQAITYGANRWPDLKTGKLKSPTKLADALIERGLRMRTDA
jgi:hypothetical protein